MIGGGAFLELDEEKNLWGAKKRINRPDALKRRETKQKQSNI